MANTLFPLPFNVHLIFCVIAFLVFGFQFIKQKRIYQLMFAVLVPATLLIYVFDNSGFYYSLGVFEIVAIVAAIVSSFFDKPKNKDGEKA